MTSLRVLLVTESEVGAGLANDALRQAGYDVESEHVCAPEAMRRALVRQTWDAVICGDRLAGFDASAALALVRDEGLDVPFLVLAEQDDAAAGPTIRASARDYRIKEEIARLVPALERELRSAAMRRERHRLMEASLDAARDWQTTFDAIGDAICLLDSDGCVLRANRAFMRLAGPLDGDVLGRRSHELLVRLGLSATYRPLDEARLSRRRATCGLDVRGRPFTLSIDPMFDAKGTFVGAVQAMTDVSERVQAETAMAESHRQLQVTLRDLREAQTSLVRQERLNALGQMVSGVAHDFNNVLMPILGLPQLLLDQPEQLGDRLRVTAVLQGVIAAANDAREIVRRLREFYQPPGHMDGGPVDVNGLVERAIMLTEPAWKVQAQGEGRSIRIEREYGVLPVIWGQESSLREVITNLLLNAVDAMLAGGVIRIVTAMDGDWVLIRVSDTGSGMTDETQQRLFEPFFTTKGARGSGLGLAASYGIVKRHGGSIDAASVLGKGSVFTVRVPLAMPATPGGEKVSAVIKTMQVSEDDGLPAVLAVLLVEDEESMRALLMQFLEHADYKVDAVASGEAALERLQAARYDVLLTDRAMPGMGGDALAREAKRRAPGMAVIMLTGFGDLMREQSEHPVGVDMVLGKPVTRTELLYALRQATERRQARKE